MTKILSKEEFVEICNILKEQRERECRLSKALEELVDGWPIITLTGNLEKILIELLEKIMNDKGKNSTISWWIYETDFGKNSDKFAITHSDGKEYRLHTAEDLYNYLIRYNHDS